MSSAEEEPLAPLHRAPQLPADELERLEERLQKAIRDDDERGLDILGYGEISVVVAWTVGEERYACKRLPLFDGPDRLERYRALFDEYLAALRRGGVTPLASSLQSLRSGDGYAAWCVQPMLPSERLLTHVMRESLRAEAAERFEQVLDRVEGAVGPRLGLDGQLSNWVLGEGELFYLDLTTPLVRDESGRDRIDAELFLASLPWALRGVVEAILLGKVVDKYYEPRGVVLDLLGNLYEEKLAHLIEPFLEVANRRLPDEPIGAEEVRRYYEEDARVWATLQRLRKVDRFWQRKIRRRPYPFLLPGEIER